MKGIDTTVGEFSKYYLNAKKEKREKLFLSNLNIQNFVQNRIITFVTAIPGSTQSKQLGFWVRT